MMQQPKSKFQQITDLCVCCKEGNKKTTLAFTHLFNNITDVIVNVVLSINGIRIPDPVSIVFQEEVLECHQIFFLECNNHLVAQAKRHQLRKAFVICYRTQSTIKGSDHVSLLPGW